MYKIYNVNLDRNLNVVAGLIKIYGIGISRARYICKSCNIHIHKKFKNVSNLDFSNIRIQLNKFLLENNLKKKKYFSIKKLINLKCYRGVRHLKKMPVRGQRTRSNARTVKGPKKKVYLKKLDEKKNFKKKK